MRLKELIYEVQNGLYVGRETLLPPTGSLNRIDLSSLDPTSIKFSRCCNPLPTEKGLYGLLSERGISVHRKDCSTIKSLKVQREDIVDLRWRFKETKVKKDQTIVILEAPTRNRVFMMLGVAPNEMKILDVLRLSRLPARSSAWEINFNVETLQGLKNVLNHFAKTGLKYEFVLES